MYDHRLLHTNPFFFECNSGLKKKSTDEFGFDGFWFSPQTSFLVLVVVLCALHDMREHVLALPFSLLSVITSSLNEL